MIKCDMCPEETPPRETQEAKWEAYAAYDKGEIGGHDIVARYPRPMIRACPVHFLQLMNRDLDRPGTTGQFVVKRLP